MGHKTVDDYIEGLDGWKKEVAQRLRSILQDAAPDAEEDIKWAQPVYSFGGPFAYFKAFKNSVNFGFWRGSEMKDPHGVLIGSGDKMRHVKITTAEDVDEQVLAEFVRQGVELNREKGDPTRR